MSAPPTPSPGPGRRPFGTVRLPAALPLPERPRPVVVPRGRWYGPQVALPLLNYHALRSL
ncbi:hypothetical protein ACFV3R_28730 [Streptomyces sp. NPDC059740]|uniref:hypothetical protein n=1 Tax=Streptomyces sp. NPDC059740 TaxID=3346926 RepID=UPI00364F2E12